MLLYFIHYKKKDKYHYKIDEVQGELKDYMKKLFIEQVSDEEIMSNIIKLIEKEELTNINDVTKYLIKTGSLQLLRKYGYIITKMLKY